MHSAVLSQKFHITCFPIILTFTIHDTTKLNILRKYFQSVTDGHLLSEKCFGVLSVLFVAVSFPIDGGKTLSNQ